MKAVINLFVPQALGFLLAVSVVGSGMTIGFLIVGTCIGLFK